MIFQRKRCHQITRIPPNLRQNRKLQQQPGQISILFHNIRMWLTVYIERSGAHLLHDFRISESDRMASAFASSVSIAHTLPDSNASNSISMCVLGRYWTRPSTPDSISRCSITSASFSRITYCTWASVCCTLAFVLT